MAVSVTINSVSVNGNGTRFVNFADGAQLEFADLASLEEQALPVDAPENTSLAHLMFLRYWLVMDPTATNAGFVAGKTLTFDLTSAQPVMIEAD